MAVGMVLVRWPASDRHAYQRDDVGGSVREGVETVREYRDRTGRRAKDDLRNRYRQVQDQNPRQDSDDGGVSTGQNTRAVGIGHHLSCTLPMMYLFGTIPQWRLSELLLRWSPRTK